MIELHYLITQKAFLFSITYSSDNINASTFHLKENLLQVGQRIN